MLALETLDRASRRNACIYGEGGVVACLMALREQWLPTQAAFEAPDPACSFPVVHKPRDARVNIALGNAFGFGGVNSTLILRRSA